MIISLISIVREASKLMLVDSFDVSQKEGFANIVTSSDVAVQDFLKTRLAALLPGSCFLCEEEDLQETSLQSEKAGREAGGFTWIIDPIDGTANYSRGIRECAICVGLKHGDDMEMAVVYLPRTDELFHAERGEGAYLNGRPIHVSERPFANSIMCTALAVYHKEYAQICSDIIVETFRQCNDIRRFGAAAPELCYLAMGRCELYFEYILSPWDFAASSLILEEAGGVLSDLSGNPLDPTAATGVLAANSRKSLERLVGIVQGKMQK